jgi:hypothetical protein
MTWRRFELVGSHQLRTRSEQTVFCPSRVLCHEHRRSKRPCATVREMKEGLRVRQSGADLDIPEHGADLSGANLSGADLRQANLSCPRNGIRRNPCLERIVILPSAGASARRPLPQGATSSMPNRSNSRVWSRPFGACSRPTNRSVLVRMARQPAGAP